MDNLLNKIIRLDNGESYVTLDYISYEGITYFLGNGVIDNKLNEDLVIFKVQKEGEEYNFFIEPNLEICQKVIEKLEEKNK